ncbi:MAG: hypothetical protein JWR80_1438 [Bradyrhizobium sp.]|nr:hypothetical protein [Bradyrhizobium sp.]
MLHHAILAAAAMVAPATDAGVPGSQAADAVIANVGFQASESARYDEKRDEYLVSNQGPPGDGNDGFISRVAPDGTVVALKWIAGGANDTTLINPLGMFVAGDLLYVADVQAVRIFDRRTGAPHASFEIKDAVRLNDLVVSGDGTIYVTDSGSDLVAGAIYAITATGKVTVFAARDPALERPNGIALTADGNLVHGGRGVNLVYRDRRGRVLREQTLPSGQIDGIVLAPGGDLLVASQIGRNVYRVPASGAAARVVAADIAVPAAIGLDTKRNRLLVPQIRAASLSLFALGK